MIEEETEEQKTELVSQEERIELWTIIANAAFKQALDKRFKKENIHVSYEMYLILNSLWEEDSQNIKSLSNILQIKSKKIKKICAELIEKELLEEHVYGEKPHFHLTEKGHEVQKMLIQHACKALEKAHQNISDEEWEICISVLKRVFLNLNLGAIKG